jgi:hypothetical protein
MPDFNLYHRVGSSIKFDGKAIHQMMTPGSPKFIWRTVKKFFWNSGRKL